jgi:hypothetical protein
MSQFLAATPILALILLALPLQGLSSWDSALLNDRRLLAI